MRLIILLPVIFVFLTVAHQTHAIDEEHEAKARKMIAKAMDYLRAQQDESGGWSVNPQGPDFPAVTGLVINGMMMDPSVSFQDAHIKAGVAYLLSHQQEDGGIYDLVLPSYNTSIAVSALTHIDSDEARLAVSRAVEFLRGLQYSPDAITAGSAATTTQQITRDHPFYGGVGYGRHGRPDNSNLSFWIQALHDAGVAEDDPAFERALVFIQRTQMHEAVNDMPYARGSRQGGFIYSTSENSQTIGTGQSFAGVIEETLDDGTVISRLRAYGSMTYAGFKSYVYARLDRDDPRVLAAMDWITSNYTLQENPGVGSSGLYYYFVTFARALDARGQEELTIYTDEGEEPHDWANDLIDRLAELQNEDGSFKSVDDKWMENDPVLITAYGLLSLEHAVR